MARCVAVCLAVLLTMLGGVARAAEPPDPHDPCSKAGKDSCATTGVGSYRTYRYGVRWFGDYRGAVPGVKGATFCIDLRYWYPSKADDYELHSTAGLKNRAGKAISAASLRQMSYAVDAFGRTNDADAQAAVMLFVHSLMGDGAPGEVDPGAVTASSRATFRQIQRDAKRYAGPYTVKATVPATLIAGTPAQLTLSVAAASGALVPGAQLMLSGAGTSGLPAKATAGDDGKATIRFTPASALDLDVASVVAGDAPALYVPTKGKAARNGQRLVAPATTTRTAHVAARVLAQPTLATQVSAPSAAPGQAISDTVEVGGLGAKSATVQAVLYGPYPAADKVTCTDTPAWSGSFTASGDGTYTTEPFTVTTPGYYVYRESIAATAELAAAQTACTDAAETSVVRAQPTVTTRISAQTAAPGAQITDTAVVSGLGRFGATVDVALWGPYPSAAAITCQGTPAWTGTLPAPGDGSYTTAPFTVPAAGYYAYQESIAATPQVDAVSTACADASETTFVKATPAVTTNVADDVVKPGGTLADKLHVSGLGKTPATVAVQLFGPFDSRAAISCDGTPYWKGSVDVTGDGDFTSPAAKVGRVGFYVFRESIAGSDTVAGVQSDCAVESETSLGAPLITTGRGDKVAEVRVAAGDAVRPTKVEVAGRGVSATVFAVGIDMKKGELGVPSDIRKVGWWRDGAAPGDRTGAILLAGHVDSAKDGAGAFYGLKAAHAGDAVSLTSSDGKTRRYRVTSVKLVLKASLPTSIFSRAGKPRLVLVTCSGPFDGRTGHYRDNLVITATPV